MLRLLFICTVIWICSACSKQIYPVQSVKAIAEEGKTLTIRSTGYGKTSDEALDAAERNAIEVLLFRGLPETQYTLPLTGTDEVAIKTKFKQYFEDFFSGGRHKSFILASVPVVDFDKHGRSEGKITADIRINVYDLQSDLETHGIIRKFGY